MDIPLPDGDDPLDLCIDVDKLPLTGKDGYGQPTPTVRELIKILSALPDQFQDMPVTRYCDEGISTIDCQLGYESEERNPDPSMTKYTLHVGLR